MDRTPIENCKGIINCFNSLSIDFSKPVYTWISVVWNIFLYKELSLLCRMASIKIRILSSYNQKFFFCFWEQWISACYYYKTKLNCSSSICMWLTLFYFLNLFWPYKWNIYLRLDICEYSISEFYKTVFSYFHHHAHNDVNMFRPS